MKRQWIVALEIGPDLPAFSGTDGGSSPDREERKGISTLIDEALAGLGERITGEAVLAAVPDARLADLLVARGTLLPLHLVVPGGTTPDPSDFTPDALNRMRATALSVNVSPGRGATAADWADCRTWLGTIAEIVLEIGQGAETHPSLPRVVVDPATSTIRYEGFPPSGTLVDEDFDLLVAEAFGGQAPPDGIAEVKTWASETAKASAPRFRFLQIGALFLNVAPGLILAAAAAFVWIPETTAIWKFGASLCAALAAIGLKRHTSRRRWLAARTVTELCRSVAAGADFIDPLFTPAARYLPRQASFARSLALGLPRRSGTVLEARDHYSKHRARHQIDYYEDQAEIAVSRRRWVRRVFYASTSLSLVATAGALLGYLDLLPWVSAGVHEQWIADFATHLFPALAAASIAYLGIHESTRRADYYRELADRLQERADTLDRLNGESSIAEAVREIESMLLEEVAGWLRRQVF